MVSHEHRCVFVHMPKCAGTSILRAFGLTWNDPDAFVLNAGAVERPSSPLSQYVWFSVVRNPYDRFVSGWKHCGFTRDRSIMDVLTNLPARQPHAANPPALDTEHYAYVHITIPQHTKLLLPDGLIGIDFIIRFESLQDDFDRVCDRIGKPRVVLPRENTTPSRTAYRLYFDDNPTARQLLEQHFHQDFELLGYTY